MGCKSHPRPSFLFYSIKQKDYVGLGLFQTLGNTMLHPETGLLFIDFEKGPTLQLTGTLIVEWTEPGASLDSADRLVIFTGSYLFFMKRKTEHRYFLLVQ